MQTDILDSIQSLDNRNFSDYKFLVTELRELILNFSKENINVIRQDKDFEGYTFRANSLDYIKNIYNKKLREFVTTFFWNEELIRQEISIRPEILKTINSQSYIYLEPLFEQSLDAGLSGPSSLHSGMVWMDHFERNYKSGYYLKPKQNITSKKSSEGCFIATFAYNSYDHQDVFILRKFRDDILLKDKNGRNFVEIYYKYSPKVVKLLNTIKFPRLLVKSILKITIIRYLKRK